MRVVLLIAAVILAAPAIAAPADRTAWLERVERGRLDYLAFIQKASLQRASAKPARAGATTKAGASDPTLRDGDVVVEGNRLLVYRSSGGASRAGQLMGLDPAAHRHAAELAEIARALRQR